MNLQEHINPHPMTKDKTPETAEENLTNNMSNSTEKSIGDKMLVTKHVTYELFESHCWYWWGQTFDTLCSNSRNIHSGFLYPMILVAMQKYANLQTSLLQKENEALLKHKNDLEANCVYEIGQLEHVNEQLKVEGEAKQQLLDEMAEAINKVLEFNSEGEYTKPRITLIEVLTKYNNQKEEK